MAISIAFTLSLIPVTGMVSMAMAGELRNSAGNHSIVNEPKVREFEELIGVEKETERIERVTEGRLENRHGQQRMFRGGSLLGRIPR